MVLRSTQNDFQNELLMLVSKTLIREGYGLVKHKRLSLEKANDDSIEGFSDDTIDNDFQYAIENKVIYQGLSKSVYEGESVIVKWEMRPFIVQQTNRQHTNAQQNKEEQQHKARQYAPLATKIAPSLGTEIASLKHVLAQSTQVQSLHCANSLMDEQAVCAVPIVTSDCQSIELNNQTWQFTSLTMPNFRQGSVKTYLNQNNLSQYHCVSLLISLAQTLATLHRLGWVHGDIKPSNFIVEVKSCDQSDSDIFDINSADNLICSAHSSNNPNNVNSPNKQSYRYNTWLIDLSYAVMNDRVTDNTLVSVKPVDSSQGSSEINDQRHIRTQTTLRGTPAYLAPECWHGSPISVQSDIYAYGILMYEILTGQRPYCIQSDSANKWDAWARAHCQSPIPSYIETISYSDTFSSDTLPKTAYANDSRLRHVCLQRIIDKLMAKQVAKRYQSMDTVLEDLKNFHND